MSIIKMTDLNLQGKRLLIREDFNVPIQNGIITSDARIQASLPTIEYARDKGAKILLMSHLGRPIQGHFDANYSLAPIAMRLSELLNQEVRLEPNWLQGVDIADGEIVLAENVRFCQLEKENDENLAKQMASLCDIFVMDAFGVAHRMHTSTYGVAQFAPIACAGPLFVAELEAVSRVLTNPQQPVVAIVAGSKVSTKLKLLESLLQQTHQIILGGGIANTFLAAKGFTIGKSLHEPELVAEAKHILEQAEGKVVIPLPTDVIVATELSPHAKATLKNIRELKPEEMILDIGPLTIKHFQEILLNAGTIIWNGPVGVFEYDQFAEGTKGLAMAIAKSKAFSIAGGGDTIAAIEKFGIADKLSYISTGGGAFLRCLERTKLPSVAILEERGGL